MRYDPYHLAIVKEKLQNRMLADIIPDMIDEVGPAVQRYIPAKGKGWLSHELGEATVRPDEKVRLEWVSMDVASSTMKIVTRACGRVFVGSPICSCLFSTQIMQQSEYDGHSISGNNEDYIDLSVQFAIEILKAGRALSMLPDFLKP